MSRRVLGWEAWIDCRDTDGRVFLSVSRRVFEWEVWFVCRDTDGLVFWSVSWRVCLSLVSDVGRIASFQVRWPSSAG